MLQQLGDHIAANTCIAASTTETDARIRTQLLDLAQQWEHVTTTYEFVASLERFLIDQPNKTLPTEVGKLPKDEPPLASVCRHGLIESSGPLHLAQRSRRASASSVSPIEIFGSWSIGRRRITRQRGQLASTCV